MLTIDEYRSPSTATPYRRAADLNADYLLLVGERIVKVPDFVCSWRQIGDRWLLFASAKHLPKNHALLTYKGFWRDGFAVVAERHRVGFAADFVKVFSVEEIEAAASVAA